MRIEIISMPRTGSTYLYSIIKKHVPNCYGAAEPFYFDSLQECSPDFAIQWKLKKLISNVRKFSNAVLKTHMHQREQIVSNNAEYENLQWTKILLLRRNIFEAVLSFTIANHINDYSNPDVDRPITIHETAFLSKLEKVLDMWKLFVQYKNQNKYHHIVYFEDLTFDPAIDLQKFNISVGPTHNEYIKRQDKNTIVKNYDDLYDHFNKVMKNYKIDGVTSDQGLYELA